MKKWSKILSIVSEKIIFATERLRDEYLISASFLLSLSRNYC